VPVRPVSDVLETIDRRSHPNADGCRIWRGMVNGKGYGMIRCGGKMITVHRVIYAARKGEIPEGMHVLHRCDKRRCCNPDHLFLGSNDDNIADKCAKDRSGKKLNIAAVREIRRMALAGMTHAKIAEGFGVNPSNISRAVTGTRWAHVTCAGGV
jgi:hypothetical protein